LQPYSKTFSTEATKLFVSAEKIKIFRIKSFHAWALLLLCSVNATQDLRYLNCPQS